MGMTIDEYINALRKCAKEHENDRTFTGHIIVSDLCRDTANLLEELEQEPRKGHWVERNPKNSKTCRLIECSECGEGYIVGYNVPFEQWIDGRNYCVHCGCKMVKENEDGNDRNSN